MDLEIGHILPQEVNQRQIFCVNLTLDGICRVKSERSIRLVCPFRSPLEASTYIDRDDGTSGPRCEDLKAVTANPEPDIPA